MKKYDTLVCGAVKNNPLGFVDALNENAKDAGVAEPLLREAASVVANLLLTDEDWHPAPDGSIKKALADWRPELNHIIETLGTEELLAQLAEEAAELCKAALKLRRALDGKNPTPVSPAEAILNVQEEMADVLLCVFSPLDLTSNLRSGQFAVKSPAGLAALTTTLTATVRRGGDARWHEENRRVMWSGASLDVKRPSLIAQKPRAT